jgi:hypothetical protein
MKDTKSFIPWVPGVLATVVHLGRHMGRVANIRLEWAWLTNALAYHTLLTLKKFYSIGPNSHDIDSGSNAMMP